MRENTVWVAPGATEFSCLCERCLDGDHEDGGVVPRRCPARERPREARAGRRPRVRAVPRTGTSSRSAASTAHPRWPATTPGSFSSHEEPLDKMIDRQHVWVGPEATSFEVPCEACLARRDDLPDTYGWSPAERDALTEGTIRRDADVGFTRAAAATGSSSIASAGNSQASTNVPSVVTVDEVRAVALTLPRSYEAFVRGRVKFRVGQIVYLAFSRDGTEMGCGFPKEWRAALVETEPEKYSLPSEHDMRYHWVHVDLAAIDADEMRDLVENAWALCVPKFVVRGIRRRARLSRRPLTLRLSHPPPLRQTSARACDRCRRRTVG